MEFGRGIVASLLALACGDIPGGRVSAPEHEYHEEQMVREFRDYYSCSEKEDVRIRWGGVRDEKEEARLRGCDKKLNFFCSNDKCEAAPLVIAKRHQNEFECNKHDVDVTSISEGVWKVRGCGWEQNFQCVRGVEAPVRCLLESKRQYDVNGKGAAEGGTSFGTCFAVDNAGTVVTAAHVVEGAKQVEVAAIGADFVEAEIIAGSREDDLVVLKADSRTQSFLTFADDSTVEVGDQVFTMGFPVQDWLGVEPKFTDGTISALRVGDGKSPILQTTVPIQPGNSGGPLVNERGQVLGIITSTAAVKEFFKATGALPQGINFAVKGARALALLETKPEAGKATPDRKSAIKRVRAALCAVRSRLAE